MRLPNFRLSTRIVIIGLAFVAAGATALMLIEDARLRDAYLRGQRVNLEGELQFQKLRLSRDIVHLRQDALFLSRTHPVSGIMRAAPELGRDARDSEPREIWEARLRYIFAAFLEAHPDYTSLRYIGVAGGGREIVRVDNRAGKIETAPPTELQAKGDLDYFKATQNLRAGQVHLSEFGADQERGATEPIRQIALHAATPVFTPSGQIFGMVVIETGAARLFEPIALDLPPGVLAYAADAGGQYLFHPDAQKRFEFGPGGGSITGDFPAIKTAFDPRAAEHFPFQADAAREPKHYLAAERVHFDPDDPARFLLFAYHLPGAVAARQMAVVPASSITTGLMVLMLAGGIALLILRQTFAPLEQLTAAADKIAAGNHDVSLPQNGSGEIGSLANALNAMLAQVSQREREISRINAGLEDRVKERTIELERVQQKTEKLLHELSAQQIELEMQNDELRRAQNIIEESRDRYVDLYDFAPVGYLTLTREALISEINLAGAALLGKERDKLIGYRFARLITPEDGDCWHLHFMRTLQHGDKQSCELVLRRDDGSRFHAQLDCLRVEADGKSPVVRISLTDITERKQAEAVLMRHKTVIDTSIDGFWITDMKGNLLEANEAYAKISGYPVDELVGMHVSQLEAIELSPEDVRAHIAKIIAQGHGRFETRHRHKDGHEIDIEVSSTYMAELQQLAVFCRDITKRERASEALRIAAAAFETQDAIMITDADGNIVRVNQAFSSITGYSPEEVLGKSFGMINSEQGGEDACVEMLQQSIRDGSWAGEVFDKRKNGQVYPKWMTVTAVKNERQETTHYVSIFSDITARKQVGEAKLRESEERFRGTMEQVAVGIAHTTLDGFFRQVNQRFCTITGYARDELLRMSYQDITFPDDLDENIRCRRQLFAGEIAHFSIEKRYVRKDRRMVWVNLTVSLLRDADGMPQYTIGVIEDISERKHSEALAQQFGSLLQNSFDEIYIFDAHTLHFLLTSAGAEENLGYSSEELNELTPLDINPLFTRESFGQLLAPLRSGEQQLLFFETAQRRKDGTTYPVEVRLQFMHGEYPVFLAIVQDVTGRRQADRELSQSRQLLRELVAQNETLREEERKSIAREVHDELGQLLTALRMAVSLLRTEFGGRDAALLEELEGITGLLDQSIQCARDVVTNLRPVALDMGIVPAVRWLCKEFTRHTGTPCELSAHEEEIHLDEIHAVAAFRVVQESLTNVARYAEASKVEITLGQDADNFSVTVSDNGKGFDYRAIGDRKSFGLLGMRERAIALGGVVNIYSAPQQGTRIYFIVPTNKPSPIDMEGDNS